MLLYVEEIRALQVRISLRLPGVDGVRIYGGPNFGFGGLIFITLQDASDRSEFSQHIRDHHVLDLELRRGVNAIDNPCAGGSFRLNQYGAHFHSPLIRIVVITTNGSHCIHANGQPAGLKPTLMTCKISTYGRGKIYLKHFTAAAAG